MDADTPLRGEPTTNREAEDHADLDLRRIGGLVRRRVKLMLVVFLIVVAVAAAITWLMTPIYEAEVTVLVNKTDTSAASSVLGNIPLIGGVLGQPSTKTQELLLEHPELTEKAAQELGLATSIKDLEYKVEADSDPDSDLVTLKVSGKDPGKAADLANRITKLFLDQGRTLAQEPSQQAAQYISTQLKQMDQTLGKAEDALRRYQAEHGVADIQASIAASIGRASTLQAQSDTADSDRAAAQHAADYFRRKLATEHATYVASSTIARNPVVQKLETDLSDLQEQWAAQSATHGPEHTEVKKLDQRIAEATKQLATAMATVIQEKVESSNPVYLDLVKGLSEAEAEVQRSAAQSAALETLHGNEVAKMAEWPDMATQLGRLKRDAQVTSDLYVMLIKNYQQMRINEATASPGVTVVAQAKLPEEPVRPQKLLYMVMGTAVGLLLAILGAVLAEALDDRMRSPEDVQRRLGLAALAVVPVSSAMEGHITGAEDDRTLGDQFRALRTSIRFASRGAVPSPLLVTSPGPDEGKTSVAFGLGVALAQTGQRVLVVDADMRRSAVHKRPSLPGREAGDSGLSAALAGLAQPMDLVRRTGIDRLSFLPAGEVPPNPVELMDCAHASEVLELLQKHFDAVIVDSPPCPAFVETAVAAVLCAASMIVIDATATRAQDARAAVEQLAGTGKPLLGVVINRARASRTRYARYYADAAAAE